MLIKMKEPNYYLNPCKFVLSIVILKVMMINSLCRNLDDQGITGVCNFIKNTKIEHIYEIRLVYTHNLFILFVGDDDIKLQTATP